MTLKNRRVVFTAATSNLHVNVVDWPLMPSSGGDNP